MTIAQKVIWAEGVFLGQQHFQLWDRYLSETGSLSASLQNSFAWGISNVLFDQESLKQGIVRLNKIQAITSSRELIDFDGIQDQQTLELDLKNYADNVISIYIGVMKYPVTNGISGYKGLSPYAWEASYQSMSDIYDSSRSREILLAKPKYYLLTEDDSKIDFNCIKIAEIIRESNDVYKFSDNYIPSLLNIGGSPYLYSMVRKLSESCNAKIKLIKQRREQFSGGTTEFGHSDLAHFSLLHALTQFVPQLKYFYSNPGLSPDKLYLACVQFLGGLSAFDDSLDISFIPDYQHEDISDTFLQIEKDLLRSLDRVIPATMSALNFVRENDNLYSIHHIDSSLLSNKSFFLAVKFDTELATWIEEFSLTVKIGAREDIETIITSALPGVGMKHLSRPPNKLPIKVGYEYFHLDLNGTFWERVKEESSLAVFLSHQFKHAHIEIVTVEE